MHDLHVWSLTPGIPLLCAHVDLSPEADPTAVLHTMNAYCRCGGAAGRQRAGVGWGGRHAERRASLVPWCAPSEVCWCDVAASHPALRGPLLLRVTLP